MHNIYINRSEKKACHEKKEYTNDFRFSRNKKISTCYNFSNLKSYFKNYNVIAKLKLKKIYLKKNKAKLK